MRVPFHLHDDAAQIARIAEWRASLTWRPDDPAGMDKTKYTAIKTRQAVIDYLRSTPEFGPRRRNRATAVPLSDVTHHSRVDTGHAFEPRLQRSLRRLERENPRAAEVVKAVFWGGCTFPEIARRTGINVNTVTQLHHKGLDKLRVFMRRTPQLPQFAPLGPEYYGEELTPGQVRYQLEKEYGR